MQEIKSPSYIHFRKQESRYARMFFTYGICTSSSRMSTQCVSLVFRISVFEKYITTSIRMYLYVEYCILASL